MVRAILESPYAGDVEKNVDFARKVCRSLMRSGFNCFASHLYYTQFLNDDIPAERLMGIDAGLEWAEVVDTVIVALPANRRRLSSSMRKGIEAHQRADRSIKYCFVSMDEAGIGINWVTEETFMKRLGE
jgi:hypothetical protein